MSGISKDSTVAVIGAGTMGAGIAQVAAQAGHPVVLLDVSSGAAAAAIQKMRATLEKRVAKGKLDAADLESLMARIEPADSTDGLGRLRGAALIIEAIVEDVDIKRALFEEIDTLVEEDTIIASNTSSISITALARGIHNPGRVIGMHFFNPPPLMALVEVINGIETDPAVAQSVAQTCRDWGKSPVFASSTPGFIVNRVARPFYGEAYRSAEEGAADYATIDAIMRESGGFRMGPFELMDLIGLDVNYAVTCSVFEAFHNDPRYKPALLQKEMVDGGLLGRKSGRGFFSYADGASRPEPNTAPQGPVPTEIEVVGGAGLLTPLISKWIAAGIKVTDNFEAEDGVDRLRVDGVNIAVTEGRPATEIAAITDEPWALVDLALDYEAATRIAVTAGTQHPHAAQVAAGLLQAAGKNVSVIADHPGMILMRTVAMLVNEACEAVHTGVAAPEAIDIAMRGGLNYPQGPMQMGSTIGPWQILEVLENLVELYGEDRYRASLYLRQQVWTGAALA